MALQCIPTVCCHPGLGRSLPSAINAKGQIKGQTSENKGTNGKRGCPPGMGERKENKHFLKIRIFVSLEGERKEITGKH